MFSAEVGSSVSPKFVVFAVVAGLAVAAIAIALAHNVIVHPWFIL